MKKIYTTIFILFIILSSHVTLAQENLIENPLTVDSAEGLIANIINTLLGVVGSLALIMFIYGGFTWILSGGNEENVKKGKQTLKWSIIGIIIIFASYAILDFILMALENKSPDTTAPKSLVEQQKPEPEPEREPEPEPEELDIIRPDDLPDLPEEHVDDDTLPTDEAADCTSTLGKKHWRCVEELEYGARCLIIPSGRKQTELEKAGKCYSDASGMARCPGSWKNICCKKEVVDTGTYSLYSGSYNCPCEGQTGASNNSYCKNVSED